MMTVDKACESFRILLEEQLARIEAMNAHKTDFATKPVITIGAIDGDGIGPIIMEQALRVLNSLLSEEIKQGSVVIKKID